MELGGEFGDASVDLGALGLVMGEGLGNGQDFLFLGSGAAEVEVEAVFAELIGGVGAGEVDAVALDGLALVPPGLEGCKEVLGHGAGLGEGFALLREGKAIEPGLLGGAVAVEEEDVGGDGGVGGEDAGGQTDDGVEIEVVEEALLEGALDGVVAKEEAIGEDDGGAAAGLEAVEDEGDEEVGGLGAGEVLGEVGFDGGGLGAAVGGIHEDDIELVVCLVVQELLLGEGVAVEDVGGVDIVEKEVGDAEAMGELFLFDAEDGVIDGGLLGCVLGGGHGLEPAGDEAAGAASEVGHAFADLGADGTGHEVGDGAGGVELTGGAGGLEQAQDGLVNLAEGMGIDVVGQVDGINFVENHAQEGAVLHVVVGFLEGLADDGLAARGLCGDGEGLERGEEVAVDEVEEGLAGEGFLGVGGPVAPTEALRDDGAVVVVKELPFILFGVVDFEEENPGELLDALGVAGDAGVVAHDVAETFDKSGGDGHIQSL